MSDIYSDITPSNFTIASDLRRPNYHIVYQPITAGRTLREVKVVDNNGQDPTSIPGTSWVPGASLALAYDPTCPCEQNDRSLFFLRDQNGTVMRQKCTGENNWQEASQLPTSSTTSVSAGGTAILACVGTQYDGRLHVFFIDANANVSEAISPIGSESFWKVRNIQVNDDSLQGVAKGPISAYADAKNLVVAYTNNDGQVGIVRKRCNARASWEQWAGITDNLQGSKLAVGGDDSQPSPVYTIFYRRLGTPSATISETARSDGETPHDTDPIGTAAVETNLAASSSMRSNPIRLHAVSMVNNTNTLFQFSPVHSKLRWVIPEGLIITRDLN